MGLNFRWLRALGQEGAAPYEFAKHPLGRLQLVFADELYSIGLRKNFSSRGLPAPDKGILLLESDLRGGIVETDQARPFTPVVLIDGEPAVTGFGRGDIDIEPGTHLVQVQSGASGAYWPVQIRPGRFTRMTSFVPQVLERKRPAEFMRQFVLAPTRSVPPRMGRLLTRVLTVLGAAAGFAAGPLAADAVGLTWPESGLLRLLFAVWFAVTATIGGVLARKLGLLIERGWNSLAESRLSLRLPVGEHRWSPWSGGAWRPVDPREDAPADADGAVLRLDAAYVQTPNPVEDRSGWTVVDEKGLGAAEKRRRQFGEDYPPEARPWVDPPRVEIDGERAPAIWGVNEYRLQPGRHRVTVSVPPPPEVLTGETVVELGPDATAEFDLELHGPTRIEAMAQIQMTPGHDGWELERYSGTLRDRSVSGL